jgi:hypothetical protein
MADDFIDDPRLHDLGDLPRAMRRPRAQRAGRLPSRPAVEGIGSLREILPLEEFTGPDGRTHTFMTTQLHTRQETRASRDLRVRDPSTGETFMPSGEPDLFTLHHLTGDHRFYDVPDEAKRGGRGAAMQLNERSMFMSNTPDNSEDPIRDMKLMRDHERMLEDVDLQNRLFDEGYDERMSAKSRQKMEVALREDARMSEELTDERARMAYEQAMSTMERQMEAATGGLESSKLGTARFLPTNYAAKIATNISGSMQTDDGDVRARGQVWYHTPREERGGARESITSVWGGGAVAAHSLESVTRSQAPGADRMRNSERMASSKRRIRFEGDDHHAGPNLEEAAHVSVVDRRSQSQKADMLAAKFDGSSSSFAYQQLEEVSSRAPVASRAASRRGEDLRAVRDESRRAGDVVGYHQQQQQARRDSERGELLREGRVAPSSSSSSSSFGGSGGAGEHQRMARAESTKQVRNLAAPFSASYAQKSMAEGVGVEGGEQRSSRADRRLPEAEKSASIVHPAAASGREGLDPNHHIASRMPAALETPLRASRVEGPTTAAGSSVEDDGRSGLMGRAAAIRRILSRGTPDLDPGFVSMVSVELASLPQQSSRRELVQRVATRALDLGMTTDAAAFSAASVVNQLTTSREYSEKAGRTLKQNRSEPSSSMGPSFQSLHRLARDLVRREQKNGRAGEGGPSTHLEIQDESARAALSGRTEFDGALRTARVDGALSSRMNDFDASIDMLSRPTRNMRAYVGAGAPVARHELSWEGQGLDTDVNGRDVQDSRYAQRATSRAEAERHARRARSQLLSRQVEKDAIESTPWMAEAEEFAAFRHHQRVRGGQNQKIMNLPISRRMQGDRQFSEERLRDLAIMESEARERGVRMAVYESSGDESDTIEDD